MEYRYILKDVDASKENWVNIQAGKLRELYLCDISKSGITPEGFAFVDMDEMDEVRLRKSNFTKLPLLYYDLVLTDGDGLEPIGLVNNGTSSISVSINLVDSDDVIIDLSGSMRTIIRGEEGNIYDVILITFTSGTSTFLYTTTDKPNVCSIQDSDFTNITIDNIEYACKLKNSVNFKVYRTL